MKNQIKESGKKEGIKNLQKNQIKINLSKSKKNLQSKEYSLKGSKNIYKSLPENKEDQKKFRGKLRRELKNFIRDILGSKMIQNQRGRSEEDIILSIKSFLSFYKKNYLINDFKKENFSKSNDPELDKEYSDLLEFIQSSLG